MASMVQATCPGCKQAAPFTREQLATGVACPSCGKMLRTAARPAAPPAAAPTHRAALAKIPAPMPDNPEPLAELSPVERRARRRKRNLVTGLVVLGVVLLGVGTLAAIYVPQLIDSLNSSHVARKDKPADKTKQELLDLVAAGDTAPREDPAPAPTPAATPQETPRKPEPTKHTSSKPSGDKPATEKPAPPQRPALVPSRPGRPQLGRRIRGSYPGRALLVGIKNYLYANPLNPGYREEQSLAKDPLGLDMLSRALTEDGAFPKEQVAILSDTARVGATAPTKEVLQGTVTEFLQNSRAADRIVLLFVGHAVLVKDQAFLVPIEGELEKPETLLPLTWLYELLDKCPARQKLLILDLSPYDPEMGMQRTAPEKLDPKLHALLNKLPKGTQLWQSSGAGQASYLYASSGMQGSVFLDTLCRHAFLNRADNWTLIEKEPALQEGTLPLVLLAPHINRKTAEYVKSRNLPAQMPTLTGTELAYNGPPASGAPAKVTVKVQTSPERKADDVLVASIMKELGMPEGARAMPAFKADSLQKYVADYENDTELRAKLKDHALRKATLQALDQLKTQDKNIRGFRRGIRANANETNFRKEIERLQQVPASVQGELEEALVLLERAGKKRDAEKAPRWQAHYDFTLVMMLTKLIQVQEYNFVLGNKLRKDAPPIKDAKNNGWQLVAQNKLQLKESRDLSKKRDKLLEKIEKDYPDTPWAVLAKREKTTALGLEVHEGRVD